MGAGFNAYQLLHGPRLRHTFINNGSGPYDLEINDTDTSVAFAFPEFLYSTQPLYVVPSFSLHLWSGPQGYTGSDLPPNAYSGFLDLGWQTSPNRMIGAELGVRLGAFTDFNTFNSKSFQVRGKGLGSFRVTPTSTFKFGVYYLNRNRIKILPAGGFLCQPNPFTRYDIFFPEPKYAKYCSTIGTYDFWFYLAGEYGGGNWTIQRDAGFDDQVDINDIRVKFGWEWGRSELIRTGRRAGFVEFGWVCDREVIYRVDLSDNFRPPSGFMVSAGIGY